jgi:hypothetical protein
MKRLFRWLYVPLCAIIGLLAGALSSIPFLFLGLLVSFMLQRFPETAQFIVNIIATIGFAISGFVSGMITVESGVDDGLGADVLGADIISKHRKGISVAIFIFILLGVVLWLISSIMVGDVPIRYYVNCIALLVGVFIGMVSSYNKGGEFKEKQPEYKKEENNIDNPLHLQQVEYNTEGIRLGFTANVNGETLEVVGIYEDKLMVNYQGKTIPRSKEEIAEIVHSAEQKS